MSAADSLSRPIESDSEDDPDFILDDKSEASSSNSDDSTPEAKRLKTLGASEEADTEGSRKAREDAWKKFQESLSSTSSEPKVVISASKTIKIEKKYRFAGEVGSTIVEVSEDSPEGIRWLASQEQVSSPQAEAGAAEQLSTPHPEPPPEAPQGTNAIQQELSKPVQATPTRPPPKLKTKGGLSKLVVAKPKKLTTLQKSKMDWNAHLDSEEAQTFKDELELNRRGGGYLEKVEFLGRVENRRDESISNLNNKRKR
ncbi:bucentaur or craniofacial development-domain-containing protein [Cantharellus anzutake]|uniref:bucentaur or craniofacial development-domain-containing protein n=1 Tax=Cantharellus anzutake TaxID=1750568 RepID=UPI0019034210|nr:bucentaur or craniofacial development-domain-containing protein [Cantharellus anzutake]KAF8325801.1 bucentaur or craniofacial development-domain-containing protein [Cantharellus anzutake]